MLATTGHCKKYYVRRNHCKSGRRGSLGRSGEIKNPLPARVGRGNGVRQQDVGFYLPTFLGVGGALSAPPPAAPGNPPPAGATPPLMFITPAPPPVPFRSSIIWLQG